MSSQKNGLLTPHAPLFALHSSSSRRALRAPALASRLRPAAIGAATVLGIGALGLIAIGRMAAGELLRPPRWRTGERWPGVPYATNDHPPAGPPAQLCSIDGALRVVGPRFDCRRPAPLAPLRVGDLILAVDGVPTDPLYAEAISAAFHDRAPGSSVRLTVSRQHDRSRECVEVLVRLPPAARDPGDLGLPFEDVRLTAADGRRLVGWFIPPAGRCPAPVLIYLHGRQTNRAHVGLTDLAARARVRGYGLLLVDLFGSGDSDGPVDHWTAAEVALGWRYLRERPEVDSGRIAVIGLSFGAYKALLAAADDRLSPVATVAIAPSDSRPRSIRLMIPPRSLPGWLRRRLRRGLTPPAALFWLSRPIVRAWIWLMVRQDITAVDPRRLAPAARSPVLMVHGTRDVTFPPASAVAAYEALRVPKELAWLSGHDHFSVCHAGEELWEPIFAFLDPLLQHRTAGNDGDWELIRSNGRARRFAPSHTEVAADD